MLIFAGSTQVCTLNAEYRIQDAEREGGNVPCKDCKAIGFASILVPHYKFASVLVELNSQAAATRLIHLGYVEIGVFASSVTLS
jgi:hypothetical protein